MYLFILPESIFILRLFRRGGWVTAHVLADPDLADAFTCAAIAHPNITLEDRIFGGNTVDLFNRIQQPLLLIPTRVSNFRIN